MIQVYFLEPMRVWKEFRGTPWQKGGGLPTTAQPEQLHFHLEHTSGSFLQFHLQRRNFKTTNIQWNISIKDCPSQIIQKVSIWIHAVPLSDNRSEYVPLLGIWKIQSWGHLLYIVLNYRDLCACLIISTNFKLVKFRKHILLGII